jgi:nucleoside-triphosphatase THEP1
MPQITLVTGPSGIGKTTRVTRAAAEYSGSVTGVICPGVYENGTRIQINAHLLRTGEILPLAFTQSPENYAVNTAAWGFNEAAIAAVNQELEQNTGTGLLVIDELGPLEFHRNQGFVSAFSAIAQHPGPVAIVVRESLLPEARQRWPDAEVEWL